MPPCVARALPRVALLLILSPGSTPWSSALDVRSGRPPGSFGRMARSATEKSVKSRAVRIFEAFTPDERVLSVSQIARRARLHLATASRLIAELESHGLLDREPDRRGAGGRADAGLALRASPTPGLCSASQAVHGGRAPGARPSRHGLGVLDGDEVLFVERLSAPGAVISDTRIAGRLPLHASSLGPDPARVRRPGPARSGSWPGRSAGTPRAPSPTTPRSAPPWRRSDGRGTRTCPSTCTRTRSAWRCRSRCLLSATAGPRRWRRWQRSCRSAPRPGPWSGSSARRRAESAGRWATRRRNPLNE